MGFTFTYFKNSISREITLLVLLDELSQYPPGCCLPGCEKATNGQMVPGGSGAAKPVREGISASQSRTDLI